MRNEMATPNKTRQLRNVYKPKIVPRSALARVFAGAEHRESRTRILQYTAPMSRAGVPVITLPCKNGAGVQLVATRGADPRLNWEQHWRMKGEQAGHVRVNQNRRTAFPGMGESPESCTEDRVS